MAGSDACAEVATTAEALTAEPTRCSKCEGDKLDHCRALSEKEQFFFSDGFGRPNDFEKDGFRIHCNVVRAGM